MVQFPESDRLEAQRIISERFSHQNPSMLLNVQLEAIKDRLAFSSPVGLGSFFHSLRSDFREFGIARRIVSGDVESMFSSLRISARFGYLLRAAGGEGYSGDNDCLHVFDLLHMFTTGDFDAVDSLTSRFPAPFRKGHPETILLCNAVYACLERHPDPESVVALLDKKTGTAFFVAMYGCLSAILKKDSAQFSIYLDQLLKGNRRQEFHTSMEKTVCLEAHAMASMWMFRHKSAIPDLFNRELPWDNEFQHYSQNHTGSGLHDFRDISPVIDHWFRFLPKQINVEELFSELKENPWRRLIRRIQVARKRKSRNPK